MNEHQPHSVENPSVKPSPISMHLNFLRDHRGDGFNEMSVERQSAIGQSFDTHFVALSHQRQDGIRQTLNGLASDIEELPSLQTGIAIVNKLAIGARIVDVFDACGIVDSAVEGGLEYSRKKISENAPEILAELEYYVNDIKDTLKVNRRRKRFGEIRETAELLLSIKSGIGQELDRLQLVPKGTSPNSIKEKDYSPRYLSILSDELRGYTRKYGLIGFSTLSKLIEEFYNVKRYSRI